jgi:hypothetical protein
MGEYECGPVTKSTRRYGASRCFDGFIEFPHHQLFSLLFAKTSSCGLPQTVSFKERIGDTFYRSSTKSLWREVRGHRVCIAGDKPSN